MKRSLLAIFLVSALLSFTACGGHGGDGAKYEVPKYAVIAWNDLGMHCMDRDYSVFAILPSYNNLHA